jgi:two-component system response regulator DesR
MTIRVIIVEDQKTMLAALSALLRLEPTLEVVGAFHDPGEALEQASRLAPDVIVSDIQMPGVDGLEFARRLRRLGSPTRVVLLSTFARAGYVEQALRLGIHGYILKDAPPERMISAIKAAAAGLRQIDDALLELYDEHGESLSERERVLIGFIREGLSNAEIAETLCLSEGTVKNQVTGVLGKLGAKNRVEACRIAERKGWA